MKDVLDIYIYIYHVHSCHPKDLMVVGLEFLGNNPFDSGDPESQTTKLQ